MYIPTYNILAEKPAFGGLLCYGAPSTAFRRKCSDASVLSKALVMTESWATEVRACPWPQCGTAPGQLRAKHACMYILIELARHARMYMNLSMHDSL